MSNEQNIGLIEMKIVENSLKGVEAFMNKGMRSGAFDLKDMHTAYENLVVMAETAKQCDLLQKKLTHLVRQQELVKQSESVAL